MRMDPEVRLTRQIGWCEDIDARVWFRIVALHLMD